PLIGILAVGKAMDVLAAGPPVARRRQLESTIATFHVDDVLHAPLAVAPFSDDDRAMVVLKRRRHNLAGTGAVLVDEHGHGKLVSRLKERSLRLGVVDLLVLASP